jgi:hypothetical protein
VGSKKQEARSGKQEARKQEARSKKWEARKQEARSKKQEARSKKAGTLPGLVGLSCEDMVCPESEEKAFFAKPELTVWAKIGRN